MEKVIALLWSADGTDRAAFNANLLARLPNALAAAGASNIRLNLEDAISAAGAHLRQSRGARQHDAVVQFWLPSANARFRGAIDAALGAHCARFHSWLVTESTIIPNTGHPAAKGTRGWGWSQASFISFRPDLPRAEAIEFWHSHHTRIAIETQANFEYVQNLIARPLTEGAPAYDAFVEECFPAEAMQSPHAFFAAVGDEAKFHANLGAMMDSCNRFIDFTRIDIIPTSQYDF